MRCLLAALLTSFLLASTVGFSQPVDVNLTWIGEISGGLGDDTLATLYFQDGSSQDLAAGDFAYSIERSAVLDDTNHMTQHLDDAKQIVYFRNQGGGGAPLGVALGPLGVIANTNMIGNETERNVSSLKGKITAEPETAFLDAALFSGISIYSGPGPAINLSSYLLVTRINEHQLRFAARLFVTYDDIGTEWKGKYVSELPVSAALAPATNGMRFKNGVNLYQILVAGFEDALSMFQHDLSGNLGTEKEIAIRSSLLSPNFLTSI